VKHAATYLFLLLTVLLIGCGKKPRVVSPTTTVPSGIEEGYASWYGKGDGYHGKRTASGEKFDRNRLTAAHYSLPFGTRVKVRNKKNGREVVVEINDRFPVATLQKGRIIDVSYRAAQLLDMIIDGVVPVVLEVLSDP
jgi:rare lipoprotein A